MSDDENTQVPVESADDRHTENLDSKVVKDPHGHRRRTLEDRGKVVKDAVPLEGPLLRPGRSTNYLDWLRVMRNLVASKYPEMNSLFTARRVRDAYPVYAEPEPPADAQLNQNNDRFGFKKAKYIKQVEMHLTSVAELALVKTKVFNFLVLHMSPESWEDVRSTVITIPNQDAEFPDVDAANPPPAVAPAVVPIPLAIDRTVEQLSDPFYLLDAILRTHSGHRHGQGSLDDEEALNDYCTAKQGALETLHSYYQYFVMKVKTLVSLGVLTPSDRQQAVHFIHGLDEWRYSELKRVLRENTKAHCGDYPKTLAAAYSTANEHTVHKEPRGMKRSTHHVAYVAQATDSAWKEPDQKKKRAEPYCGACKVSGHWPSNCPIVQEAVEEIRARKAAEEKTKVVNVAIRRRNEEF